MDKGILCTPATEAQSLATILEQKMKELDSGLLVTEVFVPNPASSFEFILGPCVRGAFPLELEPFYPLVKGKNLLLHSLDPEWHKHKTWRSWPRPSKLERWIHWVDRLEKVKGEKWRTAGIYDAIQLSKIDIPFDKNLLSAALCFWSISSNASHFYFGMMGPTVLDIVALTGLRPHREEISTILSFGRQFGMIQAVPLPPYQSANTSSLSRIVIRSVNCIKEVDSRFVQLKKFFSAVHFDANPKCTSSFESWWSTYIGRTRTESAEEILYRILP
ncbi:hypothetical protein RND71_038940 [Anisodus tanguticus]|uniref:Aminotransferase-like plant mobile domain-containing protein n=1 Tax=Anisodus tanguticus TaxID=243964 RepID=A0AAE1R011_9SOLA|nr:hypothetical protein RND71_038940 [Anisodus tanguticus]